MNETDFRKIDKCPWCKSDKGEVLYHGEYDSKAIKCRMCGFVYSDKILNEQGIPKYWNNYTNTIHLAEKRKNESREQMYEIEYNWISRFLDCKSKKILDIGCSRGQFLEHFKNFNDCFGIELDSVAAQMAKDKGFHIYVGDVGNYKAEDKYDLIICRGVIQYFLDPHKNMDDICKLLNKNGYIYIYMVNIECICSRIFKDKFSLPIKVTDYWGYSEELLLDYFANKGIALVGKRDYYEDTPYENGEEDAKIVYQAYIDRQNGRTIDYQSPSFYGSMLGMMFKKME